jgi:hypothetical protein
MFIIIIMYPLMLLFCSFLVLFSVQSTGDASDLGQGNGDRLVENGRKGTHSVGSTGYFLCVYR